MRKKVALAAVLIVIVAAVFAFQTGDKKVEGFIETEVVSLYCEAAGTVKDVPVSLGQEVKKGDILIVIDDTDARYKIQQQEQNLIKQQSALAQLEGAWDYEIIMQSYNQVTVMRESCESAREKAARLREQYEDAKTLYDAGAVSEESLREAEHQLTLAENNYKSALAQLNSAEQQLSLNQGAQGNDSQIEIAKASLVQATADLDKSKNDLEKYTIRAENDGRILSLSYRKGGVASVGSPAVDIAVESENYWVGYVPIKYLQKLEYGQEVVIKGKDITEKAKICYMDVKSQYASEDYTNNTNRNQETVKVKCMLKEDTKLKAGQNANLIVAIL
ncbi:MAG: HlyD family secretion protein [Anaerovoracaceae bacterium]